MRVLVASAQSPTPVLDGASLRLCHLLAGLRARHDVHVVCLGGHVDLDGVTSTVVPPPAQPRLATRLLRAGRSAWSEPAAVQAIEASGLVEAVQTTIASEAFDVAHLSGPPAAAAREAVGSVPCLWDAIDAWHLNRREEAKAERFPRSVLYGATSSSFTRFERATLAGTRVATVTSARDAAALRALAPRARVEVVPNGVDAEHFKPQPHTGRVPSLIAFHGNLGYAPNADAATFLAREILPRVAVHVPSARLRLVGRNEPAALRGLAGPGLELTGEVPDVRPLLAEASVYACAVRTGTGIKNKLLEAAALELPIVATTAAVGDLDLRHEEELLIADTTDGLAAAIERLLGDPELGGRLGRAARAAVAGRWSWAAAVERFERLYEEISA